MTLKGVRTCRECKVEKTLLDFDEYKRKYGTAHRVICRECISKKSLITHITCQDCNTVKPREMFPKSRNASLGVEQTCKKCRKIKFLASGITLERNRDRKGRYEKDPEFRERLKRFSSEYRDKFKTKHMLSQARIRATKNNLPFNIDVSDIIIPTHCPILGIKLSINNKKRLWDSASLDKIDNTKGYVKGNVRVISYLANHIKGKATRQELELFSKNIIPYLDGKI